MASGSKPIGLVARRPAGGHDPAVIETTDEENMDSLTSPAAELITRSRHLGADRRNTNYAGGDTSAKGVLADPSPEARCRCSGSRARVGTSER